jgi:hypothetical protein
MRYNLTLTLPAAAIEAADTETRRLAGVAIPYGEQGATSAGVLTIDAGAVKVPANLKAVKLFREHGRAVPIGYATEATDAADALRMAFAVARTPDGDQALVEASEGLRDALSVELNNVAVAGGHVVSAELVAVAQVAVPAFANAVLTAALTDDDQAKVNDLATQITDLTAPDQPEDQPAPDNAPPTSGDAAMPEATATASQPTAPAHLAMAPATPARRDPNSDRRLWAAQAAEAMRGATDAAQVNAALQDITPTSATTDGIFPRPAWLGELWNARAAQRPLIDAIGVSPLTSMEMDGWKWETEPVVAPYAGNKAAVPSSPAKIKPAKATAQRIAGGWDLDRIYVDFNTGFVEAFQQAATRDYVRKSQSYLIDGHDAIPGPPAIPAVEGLVDEAHDLGAQADALSAVAAIVAYLTGNGANVSFICMASDVFGSLLSMSTADAPWILTSTGALTLTGQANVAGTAFVVDPGLDPGTLLGGDRDAVTFWETGPVNVTAVNIPNGGIDYALFGYYAHQVHDDAGLATATAAIVAGAASSRTAKKASS